MTPIDIAEAAFDAVVATMAFGAAASSTFCGTCAAPARATAT
jgi:hypothetical protein